MIKCKLYKTCQRDCTMKRPQKEEDWKPCKFLDEQYAYPIRIPDRKGL